MVIVENILNMLDTKKYCKRCHRELKNIEAKELGYGKICYAKICRNNCPNLFEIKKEYNG